MPDPTVAGLRVVVLRLVVDWGIAVVEVPGWQTRGRGRLTPTAHVEHHTASARGGDFGALLRLLTYGHGNLRNALCNWAVPANGHAAYLVAAQTAWHAGAGGWRGAAGNSRASGTEAQNNGRGEPWTPASLHVQAAIAVEMARQFSFDAWMVCEHREWAPTRKVDRAGVNSDAWRRRILQGLVTPPSSTTKQTTTATTSDDVDSSGVSQREDLDMKYVFDQSSTGGKHPPDWREGRHWLIGGHPHQHGGDSYAGTREFVHGHEREAVAAVFGLPQRATGTLLKKFRAVNL